MQYKFDLMFNEKNKNYSKYVDCKKVYNYGNNNDGMVLDENYIGIL